MIDRMDQNQEIVNKYLNDATFQSAAFKAIVKQIYNEIRRARPRLQRLQSTHDASRIMARKLAARFS
jgi:hypothetical protein